MVSIVIVNYRSWDKLDACLSSIALQKIEGLKVIVVDNKSDDGRAADFIQQHPAVQFILQDTNLGFAQACNKGASVATNQWLLFLNPDTILPPGTLSKLLTKANNQPEWKLIGIRQFNDQGKDTHPHGIFLKWWNIWAPLRSIERLIKGRKFSKYYLSSAPITFPDWISGSFVLIRLTDFNVLGGWDERFWMYCEDMDLSKRASIKGWSRVLYNEISCIHSHGGSSRINHTTAAITKSAVIRSTFIYINKHLHGVGRFLAKGSLFKITVLDLLFSFPFSKTKRLIAGRLLSGR